jgi:hypothetical protein
MLIENSQITLKKTGEVYSWQEWVALPKERRYNILMLNGPGHWSEK